jgi:hypothetical protein
LLFPLRRLLRFHRYRKCGVGWKSNSTGLEIEKLD